MPQFVYEARDPAGQKVAGNMQAAARTEVLAALSKQGLFPLKVAADTTGGVVRVGKRIKPLVVATFYDQLGALLRSGVPLLRSLDLLRKQSSDAAFAEVLTQVHRLVEDGTSLSDAMNRFPNAFNEMAVGIIRAGGEGFLEDALQQVAQFTENQEDLKSRTLGAMAYPILLLIFGVLVVTGLLVFCVPKFEPMFQRLREKDQLPLLTDGLLGLSHFLATWGLLLLPLLGAAVYFGLRQLKTDAGRLWFDRIRIRLPLFGNISKSLAIARLCRVLGTLLHNGVPILRSLEISSSAIGNRLMAQAVTAAGENVSSGESLSRPLAACGLFPASIVEMIHVAEEANTLESVLRGIADNLERRTWRQLELAVRLLEPLMLLLLASMILAVVIALVVPLLRLSETM